MPIKEALNVLLQHYGYENTNMTQNISFEQNQNILIIFQ